jgi:putative ABC transport system ATP-binding protein
VQRIVELKNVVKEYGAPPIVVQALREVDLAIDAGEFVAMAGPSGSGKSTLLNIIGALDVATSGSVSVADHDLATLSRSALSRLRREQIGFVFQNFNLVPVLTALENAEYVLLLQGVPRRERRDRVRAILSDVGLDGLEDRFPGELSGGQQQRVAIARSIVAEPALVLADEPTANVDSATGEALIDVMRALHADKMLTDGRITADGSPAEILGSNGTP